MRSAARLQVANGVRPGASAVAGSGVELGHELMAVTGYLLALLEAGSASHAGTAVDYPGCVGRDVLLSHDMGTVS